MDELDRLPAVDLADSPSDAKTGDVPTPVTRYAKSGETYIAYQVVGDGPPDLVCVPGGPFHTELSWEIPAMARSFTRLAGLTRLIIFDKRGAGMSDPVDGLPTLEARMDDIRAVMDEAGSRRAVLLCNWRCGPALRSLRCHLPRANSRPRALPAHTPLRAWARLPVPALAGGGRAANRGAAPIPSRSLFERAGTSQVCGGQSRCDAGGAASLCAEHPPERQSLDRRRLQRANLDVDVCEFLPLIRVPTLVLVRPVIGPRPFEAPGIWPRIPGARLVELPGASGAPSLGDQEPLFAEIERFLQETRDSEVEGTEPERVLSTLLFTDIVDATSKASELGDRAWRELLGQHHGIIRGQLSQFRGREVDTAGDGFFATFDGPARAIDVRARSGTTFARSASRCGLDFTRESAS